MPAITRVGNLGGIGIIKDLEPHVLPPNAWSDGNNMRFFEGKARKAAGWADIKNAATIKPYDIFLVKSQLTNFWVYCGLTDVRAFDSVTEVEITRTASDYTATTSSRWNFCMLNGEAIFNNGVDDPQLWTTPDLGTLLVDLTNWPASFQCNIMRAYLNFLVAFNINDNGTRFPNRVKWSDSSVSGVPSSWDDTDATKDTGENDIGDEREVIVDATAMGNSLIIYKENSTWSMRFIGGALKMGFQPLFRDQGLLAQDCAQPFGKSHFSVTRHDVIVHDGTRWESVIDAKNRRYFFDNLDPEAAINAFTIHVRKFNEMWICAPRFGLGVVTEVAVWNYRDNTWSFRDLPGVRGAAAVIPAVASVGDSWDFESTIQWSSLVDADSNSGQKVLNVDVTDGFLAGDSITINEGGARDEDKIIDTIQDGVSLTTTVNLASTHTAVQADEVINATITWDDLRFLEAKEKMYFADTDNTKILELNLVEDDFQQSGTNYRSFIERTGITIVGSKASVNLPEGTLVFNPDVVKMLIAVRPQIKAVNGTVLDIYIAAVMNSEDTYNFGTARSFTVGTTIEIVAPVTGRFLGIRIEETLGVVWSINSVGLEITVVGLN